MPAPDSQHDMGKSMGLESALIREILAGDTGNEPWNTGFYYLQKQISWNAR